MTQKKGNIIVGADTHKKFHVVSVITELGVRLEHKSFSADAKGYREALAWASGFGTILRAGIEGTGGYGAGLSTHFIDKGIAVLDVNKPDKHERRKRGKDDVEDSFQAAAAALAFIRCSIAKENGEELEAARLLEATYGQAIRQRTASINALRADLVTLPDAMRQSLEGMTWEALAKRCAAFRLSKDFTPENARKRTLRSLARRILALTEEAKELEAEINRYAKALAPKTLTLLGVGCHGAIRLMCTAGQNIERMSGEAAFSMMCGVSPIPASSGDNIHFRLNRGGERRANCAIHTMATTRLRNDERSRAYYDKKISEGKGENDAMRCLKRYCAREVYGFLKQDLLALGMAC
jgi:hypothetical protein